MTTIVSRTVPASKQRAAPWVRLTNPEATAASWSARSRGSRSDAVSNSPSAETTIACATPGASLVNFVIAQPRSLG